ncbi:MAG: hypothetical protein JSW51_02760, partial [Gemmatimonadota bacterium]
MDAKRALSPVVVALVAVVALGGQAAAQREKASADDRFEFHRAIDRFAKQLSVDVEEDDIGA